MTLDNLINFFLWATIINFAVLSVWALAMLTMSDFIYNLHSKFYKISREKHAFALYMLMGIYDIGVLIFFFTPYVVLRIIS